LKQLQTRFILVRPHPPPAALRSEGTPIQANPLVHQNVFEELIGNICANIQQALDRAKQIMDERQEAESKA
jgi:hypothetical protein